MVETPDFKKLFEEKYQGYSGRAEPLPHFEPETHARFLTVLSAGGHSMPSRFGYARLEGETGYTGWTMFFLHQTQGGKWTGEGILVRYPKNSSGDPLTGRFWLCKHDVEEQSSPEARSRGDHRRRCKMCGLNMSYDSSG